MKPRQRALLLCLVAVFLPIYCLVAVGLAPAGRSAVTCALVLLGGLFCQDVRRAAVVLLGWLAVVSLLTCLISAARHLAGAPNHDVISAAEHTLVSVGGFGTAAAVSQVLTPAHYLFLFDTLRFPRNAQYVLIGTKPLIGEFARVMWWQLRLMDLRSPPSISNTRRVYLRSKLVVPLFISTMEALISRAEFLASRGFFDVREPLSVPGISAERALGLSGSVLGALVALLPLHGST